ncbi:MAG: acyl-CoA/acyl-ACP dehydrogenase [Thermoflexaceae bacterium]|nr:acyl-CoA/acyl-ACP dehydrogenase [Thermoflexaceae bacterium]
MTVAADPGVRSASDLIAAARTLAADFATRAGDHDRDATFPFENFEALRAAGLLNLTVPREYGGEAAGLDTVAHVLGAIGAGDPSTALVLSMQYVYHAMEAMRRAWPAGVYERVARESVAGTALMNALRVEPELGTPARGGMPATTATRTAAGWRLTGHKVYATGSPILRYYLVFARTDEETPRTGHFLVPSDAAGLRLEKTWNHMGLRASGSDDLIIEGTELPAEHALDLKTPQEWQQQQDPQSSTWNTVIIAAMYNGVAKAARDWLTEYLHKRVPSNLGASLATLPRHQTVTGEMEVLLYTNGQLIHGLAQAADAGGTNLQGGIVKHAVTQNAIRVVELALELVGNPGLSRNNPLERHYRDVLCGRIHTPQSDMVLLNAGKAALGVK